MCYSKLKGRRSGVNEVDQLMTSCKSQVLRGTTRFVGIEDLHSFTGVHVTCSALQPVVPKHILTYSHIAAEAVALLSAVGARGSFAHLTHFASPHCTFFHHQFRHSYSDCALPIVQWLQRVTLRSESVLIPLKSPPPSHLLTCLGYYAIRNIIIHQELQQFYNIKQFTGIFGKILLLANFY